MNPFADEMLTIEPPPLRLIGSNTARIPRNTPVVLTAIVCSYSSKDVLSSGENRAMPALLTSTLGGPKVSSQYWTASAHWPSSVTSSSNAAAMVPISAATARQVSGLMSQTRTLAP